MKRDLAATCGNERRNGALRMENMRFKKPWLKNWIRRDGQQSQTLLIPKSVEYCFDCPILVIPNVIGCLTGFHGRRKCMYVLVHWLMRSGYGVPTPGVHVLLFVFFFFHY